ncbi:hypothetical protein ABZ412_21135 [Nocardia sp. NPDC005746]|uniref:hypothetical protein n=1 Tax=Nocardia sp. NPDC005746 TaxID=3157062 RepID=UPI0033E207AA
MSTVSPWSAQSIIERIESERRRGGSVGRRRRRPTPHRRRSCGAWRFGVALLALTFLDSRTAGLGGRHAVR